MAYCDMDPSGFLMSAVAADVLSAKATQPDPLASLSARIRRLEERRSPAARRALRDLQKLKSWRFRWVPEDYYSRSMTERSELLCCTIDQMCKSVLLENKKREGEFYLVVLQYAAALNENKLRDGLSRLTRLSKSSFNLRFASPEDNARLTGYEKGAVTPFGTLEKIKVVLAEAARRESLIWMGGGHPDLKFGCSVDEFINRFDAIVLDASEPRREEDSAHKLLFIVGKVVEAWEHPESDKLFCEKIDCGSFGGIRPIASGLRAHYEQADLVDRLVLVCANLKPRKLAGFASEGMVLCATDAKTGNVVFVDPPATAKPGDRVYFGADNNDVAPASEKECDKLGLFSKAQPHFVVASDGVVYYKDLPFMVSGKIPCTAHGIAPLSSVS